MKKLVINLIRFVAANKPDLHGLSYETPEGNKDLLVEESNTKILPTLHNLLASAEMESWVVEFSTDIQPQVTHELASGATAPVATG